MTVDLGPVVIPLIEMGALLKLNLRLQAQIISDLEKRDFKEVMQAIDKELEAEITRTKAIYKKSFPQLFTDDAYDDQKQ